MRFFLAIVAYVAIAAVLGTGILKLVQGEPWVLIVGAACYLLALGTLGCLPKKTV